MSAALWVGLGAALSGTPPLAAQSDCSTGSLAFFVNAPREHDYGQQVELPAGFGRGEFTLELWIRPDESFPVGPIPNGSPDQLIHWSDADNEPYGSGDWWYEGNFLLDGHNNSEFRAGTFSLQFYGEGRLRWLFGDGAIAGPGGHWSVGAYPATRTPSLLDGRWHAVTLVRRWAAGGGANLELWIDGSLVATEETPLRTDMWSTYWQTWDAFPSDQEGWFWGAEKQAAIGILSQYEDYKGPIDDLRFWSRAKSRQEIVIGAHLCPDGSDPDLLGRYRLDETAGTTACDALAPDRCIELVDMKPGYWSEVSAPLGLDLFADGFESGDTSAWTETVGSVAVVEPGLGGSGRSLEVTVAADGAAAYVEQTLVDDPGALQIDLMLDLGDLDQGGLDLGGEVIELLRLEDGLGNSAPHLQLFLFAAGDGTVRTGLLVTPDDGSPIRVGTAPLRRPGTTHLRLVWRRADSTDGTVRLYRNGRIRAEVTGLSLATRAAERLRLGLPNGTPPLSASGSFRIDEIQVLP